MEGWKDAGSLWAPSSLGHSGCSTGLELLLWFCCSPVLSRMEPLHAQPWGGHAN